MIKRIYIDTSVFGGYFDTEFEADTKPFFERIWKQSIKIIISELLELELYEAPEHIVNLEKIRGYNSINFREGYPMIEIRTPKEIFGDEKDWIREQG